MKKIGMIGVALASVMTMGVLAACGEQSGPRQYDTETDPFVMGLQTPDNVFNPFFSTSLYDSNIISWTQIGMLNTDKDGNIVCGENEMCAVKDYTITYDANDDTDPTDEYTGTSTYRFAIKNGIKFSDGEPLTIKDVLFNLYVYLDYNYTGSSTIYSTPIIGLDEYRLDDPNVSSSSGSDLEETFLSDARIRIQEFLQYVKDHAMGVQGVDKPNIDWTSSTNKPKADRAKKDFFTIKEEFWKELNTTWNGVESGMETYVKQEFEEAWQAFLFVAGGNTDILLKDAGGNLEKNEDNNYIFDKDSEDAKDLKEQLTAYLADKADKTAATKRWAIEHVFEDYFPDYTRGYDPEDPAHDTKDTDADTQISALFYDAMEYILNYTSTSDVILSEFAAEAKQDYFGGTGARKVETIEGIKVYKSQTLAGDKNKDLGEECDILQIKIKGVDPKAIYNFSFLVAPMHYYSGTFNGKNYIEAFNGDIASDLNAEKAATVKGKACFGLEPASKDFMDDVINAASKVGLPVGAGPYMASTRNGGTATSGSQFFYQQSRVYYERNPYFYTVLKKKSEGDTEEVQKKYNAKIKYIQYFVVPADQYISNLIGGELDYADPSASTDNIDRLNGLSGISIETPRTAGYGYIGINPRHVPNIYVRRAIMMAFNTQVIFDNYYPSGLGEPIYRPMSKANWAYPESAQVYKTQDNRINGQNVVDENGKTWDGSYAFDGGKDIPDQNGDMIEAIVKAAGYTKSGGVYQKTIEGFTGKNGNIDRLDYTFTIAGASQDHPAYVMLLRAKDLLNEHGFDVKVTTSQTALSDLTIGKLAVWAAAWTSTVDPDMYQVYHMDSRATSVNNWGYPQIKQGKSTVYAKEYSIITELSELIDEGRRTNDREGPGGRIAIYAAALDKVMELAVEFPTYQRVDLLAFNSKKLKRSSMPSTKELGAYNGLLARIWEVDYN